MERRATQLSEVWELRPRIFGDSRGIFLETYHQRRFYEQGIREAFVQDNFSVSKRGTVRGLHYQLKHPQAKLCSVVEGQALDFALDIRLGSPSFGQWASVLLTAEDHNQIFIPAGFAHGFVALTDQVKFLYKCSDFYDASGEHGVLWNDPEIAIPWNVESPLVSDKDARLPRLAQVPREFLPIYAGGQ